MSSDEEALRAANRNFYDAIESCDLAAMRRVWSPEQVITCVHPNCEPLAGWDTVVESWRLLFEVLDPWSLTVEEQKLVVSGDIGWLVCVERYDRGEEEEGDEEDGEEEDEPLAEGEAGAPIALESGEPDAADESQTEEASEEHEGAEGEIEGAEGDDEEDEDGPFGGVRLVAATHLFMREEGQWKLAHRHASPFEPQEEEDDELVN